MSSKSVPSIEDVGKITDPGEVGREDHTWGDRLVINIANVFAWSFPILIACIVAQILLRLSGHNQAWLDDLQWWIYGAAVLSGFGYAIVTNSHVRVDILYDNYSPEKKARTEIFGIGWLLLPFIVIMTDILIHYAISSWQALEGSDSPNGLHNLYLLKTLLPMLFITAGIGAWSVFYRNLKTITEPTLVKQLLWAFPTTLMLTERVVHYAAYWVIRLANPEIPWRQVSREPFFEYTTWVSLGLIALLIAAAWLMGNKQKSGR
jgi:TRAP-type mannitol/chloroaromatic compound transport system permease small subunit